MAGTIFGSSQCASQPELPDPCRGPGWGGATMVAAPDTVATAGVAASAAVVGDRCWRPRRRIGEARPAIGAQHRIAVVIGRRRRRRAVAVAVAIAVSVQA